VFEKFDHLGEFRVGAADLRDARVARLNQAHQGNGLRIGREADLHDGLGLVFFGRVELRKTRAQRVRLPILGVAANGLLFGAKIDQPYLGPVLARVADQNDFKERILRFQVEFVMELGNEWAQLLEKGNADRFEVRFARIRRTVRVLRRRMNFGHFAVEANRAGLRGDLPFRCAKENADVFGTERGGAGRNGFGFEGLIDGTKDDGVPGDQDDHPPAGQVGDDFVFLRTAGRGSHGPGGQQPRGDGDRTKRLHGYSILRVTAGGDHSPFGEESGKIKGAEETRKGAMGLRKLKQLKHNGRKVTDILEAHERFWSGKQGGARADLGGADLSGADLSKLNLAGANLRGANLDGSDLRGARLPVADLSGARLKKTDLRNTDMTEAHLPGADLTEAQASGVEFFRCDLSNANFRKALLRNANFRDANVDGAVFTGADLGIAILRETDISKADLTGVDLSTTLMPPGFAAKKQGA